MLTNDLMAHPFINAMNAVPNERCRLCNSPAQLVQSHIIPKFVIRRMKETGTGYFRRAGSPNIRLQDGIKVRMLCQKCETMFSTREEYFSSQIFKQMQGGAAQAEYDERFAYFVISLLWRVVQLHSSEARSTGYRFLEDMERVSDEWKSYLLGAGALKRSTDLHCFIVDFAVENPPGVPNFNLYCMRAIDCTLFDYQIDCYVVAKFTRFFFVAPITRNALAVVGSNSRNAMADRRATSSVLLQDGALIEMFILLDKLCFQDEPSRQGGLRFQWGYISTFDDWSIRKSKSIS